MHAHKKIQKTKAVADPYCPKCSARACGKYHVYVVELDPQVLRERRFWRENRGAMRDPECFYVGSTKHSCGCRLGQHVCFAEGEDTYACHCSGRKRDRKFYHAGGRTRGNKYAGKYGRALRPDLFIHLNPMRSRAQALKAEKGVAEFLKSTGAAVWQR